MRISINRLNNLLITLMLAFCSSVYADNQSVSIDDRSEIQQLLSNYAHAWDSKDVERFVSLFTEDSIIQVYLAGELAAESVTIEQRTQRAIMRTNEFKKKGIQTRHYMANTILITQPDNSIKGETYFYVVWQYEGEASPIPKHTGIYVDTFVKTNNGWKFSKHETRVDHN